MSAPRILLAEDQAIVAMELEDRLRRLGYEVCDIATTAADAVTYARRYAPDILLFDIRLRGESDGIEAAREIITERPVPVVFLSAYADARTVTRVRELDHSSYLLKPFDERMLEISLEAALYRFRVAQERDREERARRRSEARLAAMLDHSPDGIVSLDPEGRISVFNRGAERIFGYAAAEVIGQPLEVLLPHSMASGHAEKVAAFVASEERGRAMGSRGEVVGRRKDGELFPAEASIFRARVDDGEIVSAIVRDATERKRLEARSVQAQKLEAVGRLAAGVAHDFNNLLSAVHCNAYLASLDAPPETRALVDEILASVQRGAALTRQLLAFARREPTQPLPTDVNVVLAAMEALVRTLAGGEVETAMDLEVGAGVASIDLAGFEQAVMNLVVNARDAMPRGGKLAVRSRARRVEEPGYGPLGPIPPGVYVEVAISDSGQGIAPEVRSRMFEPFFTTKPLGHGTGLGLMMVSEVLRACGGHVEIESEPGHGTTFRILLPALDVPPAPRPGELRRATVVSRRVLTILLVDDDDALRTAAARILAHEGFVVYEARTPEEAIRIASRADDIDVVLSDVVMPSMGGPALLEMIRELRPNVGTVLMSGYAELGARRPLLEGRVVLRKPFRVDELLERIRMAAPQEPS